MKRLQLSSTIAWFHGAIGGSLHRLFKLDVRLKSGKDFTHLGDVVLQEVFVQGVTNLQASDKYEGENFLPTI